MAPAVRMYVHARFLFSCPQDPKPNSFFGSTLGAVIESYYRSGLNSWLNAKLTGKPPASMFPMFHVQIPTRVVYINGFKVSWTRENCQPQPLWSWVVGPGGREKEGGR